MDFNQWIQDFIQRTIEFLPQLIFGIIIFAIAVFISGPAARWVEKKAAAQKLKIDEVYLMVACPDGSCDIVAKERGR